MKRYSFLWIGLLVALVLAACAPTPAGQQTVTPGQLPGQDQMPSAVVAAQQVLAEQLGVDIGEVEVRSMEQVQWPNACLGLPGPDEMCAEVITEGYRIILVVNGQAYTLHTNQEGSQVRQAVNDEPKGNAEPKAVQQARAFLAQQLGKDVQSIQVVRFEAVEWPNSCLGIEDPARSCLLVITPGYRVILSADGTEYIFHTDQEGAVILPAPQALPQMEGPVVISWNREGGIAGFCDDLKVYDNGLAYASNCKNGELVEYTLNENYLVRLMGWRLDLQSFTYEQADAAAADAMKIRYTFEGKGSQEPTQGQKEEIALLLQDIYNQAMQAAQ